jgi:large subunit ribosomal protein L1
MAHPGKRYRSARQAIEAGKLYTPAEAMALLKQTASAKFDETVEAAVRLGVDARQGEQMVRGTVTLPHGTGKPPRVAAVAQGERAQEAEAAGADAVGGEDLVQKIDEGWRDFDILVATRDMMRIVGRLGKKLGPRMPSPKSGTVSDEIGKTIRELKGGKVEYRIDKAGIVHIRIGRASFTAEQLAENLAALVGALIKSKPPSAKGQYLRRIVVSATMGPGVAVDLASLQSIAEKAAA